MLLYLPEKTNLTLPTAIRNRNRITQFRAIERHESFAMLAHNSPSLLEALPGLFGQPSHIASRVSRPTKEGTYGLR